MSDSRLLDASPTLPAPPPSPFDALDGEAPLVNRVADSEIDVVDLGALLGDVLGADVRTVDLAPWLHRGLVLREVDFRGHVAAHDWAAYAGAVVALTLSVDALVPTWAWMLVAARLSDAGARHVGVGDPETVRSEALAAALAGVDLVAYRDRIVVVKGCGAQVPAGAYAAAMARLAAAGARKVMYGEPCSSVPLWRRPRATVDAPASAAPGGARPIAAASLATPPVPPAAPPPPALAASAPAIGRPG